MFSAPSASRFARKNSTSFFLLDWMGITMRSLIASLHILPTTLYLFVMSTRSFSIQSSVSRHDVQNSAPTSIPPTTRHALPVDAPLLTSRRRQLRPNSGSGRATLPLAVAHKAQRCLLPLANRDSRADNRVVAAVLARCAKYAPRWGTLHPAASNGSRKISGCRQ
jgi:hypothetical protein